MLFGKPDVVSDLDIFMLLTISLIILSQQVSHFQSRPCPIRLRILIVFLPVTRPIHLPRVELA